MDSGFGFGFAPLPPHETSDLLNGAGGGRAEIRNVGLPGISSMGVPLSSTTRQEEESAEAGLDSESLHSVLYNSEGDTQSDAGPNSSGGTSRRTTSSVYASTTRRLYPQRNEEDPASIDTNAPLLERVTAQVIIAADQKESHANRLAAALEIITLFSEETVTVQESLQIAANVIIELLPQLNETEQFKFLRTLAALNRVDLLHELQKFKDDTFAKLRHIVYLTFFARELPNIDPYRPLLRTLDLPENFSFYFNDNGELSQNALSLLENALRHWMNLDNSSNDEGLGCILARIQQIRNLQQRHKLLGWLAKKHAPALCVLTTELEEHYKSIQELVQAYVRLPFSVAEFDRSEFTQTLLARVTGLALESEDERLQLLIQLGKVATAAQREAISNLTSLVNATGSFTDPDELRKIAADVEAFREALTADYSSQMLLARVMLPTHLFQGVGADGTATALTERSAISTLGHLNYALFTVPAEDSDTIYTIFCQMAHILALSTDVLSVRQITDFVDRMIETIKERNTQKDATPLRFDASHFTQTLVHIAIRSWGQLQSSDSLKQSEDAENILRNITELLVLSTNLNDTLLNRTPQDNLYAHALESLTLCMNTPETSRLLFNLAAKLISENKIAGNSKLPDVNARARQTIRLICVNNLELISQALGLSSNQNAAPAATLETDSNALPIPSVSPSFGDLELFSRKLRNIIIALNYILEQVDPGNRPTSAAQNNIRTAQNLIASVESHLEKLSPDLLSTLERMVRLELLLRTNYAVQIANSTFDSDGLVISSTPSNYIEPVAYQVLLNLATALVNAPVEIAEFDNLPLTRQLMELANNIGDFNQYYGLLKILATKSNLAAYAILQLASNFSNIDNLTAEQAQESCTQIVRLWTRSNQSIELARIFTQFSLHRINLQQATRTATKHPEFMRTELASVARQLVEFARTANPSPQQPTNPTAASSSSATTAAVTTPHPIKALFQFFDHASLRQGLYLAEAVLRETMTFFTATTTEASIRHHMITMVDHIIANVIPPSEATPSAPTDLLDDNEASHANTLPNLEYAGLIGLTQLRIQLSRVAAPTAGSSWWFGNSSSTTANTPVALEDAVAYLLERASRTTIAGILRGVTYIKQTSATSATSSVAANTSPSAKGHSDSAAPATENLNTTSRAVIRLAAMQLIQKAADRKLTVDERAILLYHAAEALDIIATQGSDSAKNNIRNELKTARDLIKSVTSDGARVAQGRINMIIDAHPQAAPSASNPSTPLSSRRESSVLEASADSTSNDIIFAFDETPTPTAASANFPTLEDLLNNIGQSNQALDLIAQIISYCKPLEGNSHPSLPNIASTVRQVIEKLRTANSETNTTKLQTFLSRLIEDTLRSYGHSSTSASASANSNLFDDCVTLNEDAFRATTTDASTSSTEALATPNTNQLASREEVAMVQTILEIRSYIEQLKAGFKKKGLFSWGSNNAVSNPYAPEAIRFIVGNTLSEAVDRALTEIIIRNAPTTEAVTALVSAIQERLQKRQHALNEKDAIVEARKRVREVAVKLQQLITDELNPEARSQLLDALKKALNELVKLGSDRAELQLPEIDALIRQYTPSTTTKTASGSSPQTSQEGARTPASAAAAVPPSTIASAPSSSTPSIASPTQTRAGSAPRAVSAYNAWNEINNLADAVQRNPQDTRTLAKRRDIPFAALPREHVGEPDYNPLAEQLTDEPAEDTIDQPVPLTPQSLQIVRDLVTGYVRAGAAGNETTATRQAFDQQPFVQSLINFIRTLPNDQRRGLLLSLAQRSNAAYSTLINDITLIARNPSTFVTYIHRNTLESLWTAGHHTPTVAEYLARIVAPLIDTDDQRLNSDLDIDPTAFGTLYPRVIEALLTDESTGSLERFFKLCAVAPDSSNGSAIDTVRNMLEALLSALEKQKPANIKPDELATHIRAFIQNRLEMYNADNIANADSQDSATRAFPRINRGELTNLIRIFQLQTRATQLSSSNSGRLLSGLRSIFSSSPASASTNAPAPEVRITDEMIEFFVEHGSSQFAMAILLGLVTEQENKALLDAGKTPDAAQDRASSINARMRLHTAAKAILTRVTASDSKLPTKDKVALYRKVRITVQLLVNNGSSAAKATLENIDGYIRENQPAPESSPSASFLQNLN